MSTKKVVKAKTRVKKNSNSSISGEKKNRISEVIHETAQGFYAAGLMDKTTMREFDSLCLTEVPQYSPKQIQAIRKKCQASQSVFAAYMNITLSALQKWETGARKPDNVAMKMLQIIENKGLEALLI